MLTSQEVRGNEHVNIITITHPFFITQRDYRDSVLIQMKGNSIKALKYRF